MPQLSLTDFVDVVSTSGTPRFTKVKRLKGRQEYHPAYDFYRPLREHIVNIHKHHQSKRELPKILDQITDEKKLANYPEVIDGYARWWGRKTLKWFPPAGEVWSSHGIDVRVNPELGLFIGKTPHLIKLYFKSTPLPKNRADIITHLMAEVLEEKSQPETVMAVLDIRRSKLIIPTIPIVGLRAMLDAELSYIATLWEQI